MLENSKIPKGTECPFRSECGTAKDGMCNHQGKQHKVAFSCGTARLFVFIKQNKEEQ